MRLVLQLALELLAIFFKISLVAFHFCIHLRVRFIRLVPLSVLCLAERHAFRRALPLRTTLERIYTTDYFPLRHRIRKLRLETRSIQLKLET